MTSHLEVYYSSAEPQQYYFSKCFPGSGLGVVLVAVGTVKCSAGQAVQLNREYRGVFTAVWRAALSVHSPASWFLHECTAQKTSGVLSDQLQVLRRDLEIHEHVRDKY